VFEKVLVVLLCVAVLYFFTRLGFHFRSRFVLVRLSFAVAMSVSAAVCVYWVVLFLFPHFYPPRLPAVVLADSGPTDPISALGNTLGLWILNYLFGTIEISRWLLELYVAAYGWAGATFLLSLPVSFMVLAPRRSRSEGTDSAPPPALPPDPGTD